MKFLAPYSDRVYALLRIVAGFMFLCHGLQKVFGFFPDPAHPQPAFGSFMWIGGFLELVCGLMIMLGLRASLAAFIASGEMAVAYFKFHWKLELGQAFFPIVNHGELAALYCFVFLFIACRGSGPWSIDAAQRRPVAPNLGSAVRGRM